MPSTSFAFDPDDFSSEFQLEDDADPAGWPAMEVEFDYRWHGAEPDVGIFGSQIEFSDIRYLVDGVTFGSDAEMVDAIFEAIGDEIEEGQDYVATKVAAQIKVWESDIEELPDDD